MITAEGAKQLTAEALAAQAAQDQEATRRLAEQQTQEAEARMRRQLVGVSRRICSEAEKGGNRAYVPLQSLSVDSYEVISAVRSYGFRACFADQPWAEVDGDGDLRHRSTPSILIEW
jgi:hypothetical protein